MVLEEGKLRNCTIEEIKSKRRNIYLGISLRNKWFNEKNISDFIDYALNHTKEKVGLVIADTLQAINYRNVDNYSEQAAHRKALKEGDELVKVIEKIIYRLPNSEKDKIVIIRWDDVKKDTNYANLMPLLTRKLQKDPEFKNAIKKIVSEFFERKKRNISDEKIEKSCLYIVDEMPEMINGFEFGGIKYNCVCYPFDSSLTILIEDIQQKKIFPEITAVCEGKNAFLELG